jgi:hypothetical protein
MTESDDVCRLCTSKLVVDHDSLIKTYLHTFSTLRRINFFLWGWGVNRLTDLYLDYRHSSNSSDMIRYSRLCNIQQSIQNHTFLCPESSFFLRQKSRSLCYKCFDKCCPSNQVYTRCTLIDKKKTYRKHHVTIEEKNVIFLKYFCQKMTFIL